MKRREFIAGVSGAAASLPIWPFAVRAQQRSVPVIGLLQVPPDQSALVANVHRGLSETGYVEGRSLAVEYRWAENRLDRLPALADDLVRRQVSVIVAMTTPAAVAAKAATKSIPIVFGIASDPVEIGLVASLNRPGGNLTGVTTLNSAVAAKRLELLHEIVPGAMSIGYLVNPTNPVDTASETRELQAASRILGVRLLIVKAGDESEFGAAVATVVSQGAGGLVISAGVFFSYYDPLVALAARYRVPALYPARDAVAGGGLMSYATDYADPQRLVGAYTGRILKGAKPADLPVQQVTKMQLTINMKTAKALGITFPRTLLGRADEVIE
jgi:putative tryptophan/tyrosine transport system substrate-binding protein